MSTLEYPDFPEGTDVAINAYSGKYEAVAMELINDGMDWKETPVDLEDDDTFEVISVDYDRGLKYHLRLNGERDGFDYIRVFNVEEDDLEKV